MREAQTDYRRRPVQSALPRLFPRIVADLGIMPFGLAPAVLPFNSVILLPFSCQSGKINASKRPRPVDKAGEGGMHNQDWQGIPPASLGFEKNGSGIVNNSGGVGNSNRETGYSEEGENDSR
jgi:hypothetical protein